MEYPTVARVDSLERRIERIEREHAAAEARALKRALFFCCFSSAVALAAYVFMVLELGAA